jgi:hypothetical protein
VVNYASIFDKSFENRITLCTQKTSEDNASYERYPYWDEVKFLEAKREKDMWTLCSQEIFTVFWQLELQDITKPDEFYADYIGG